MKIIIIMMIIVWLQHKKNNKSTHIISQFSRQKILISIINITSHSGYRSSSSSCFCSYIQNYCYFDGNYASNTHLNGIGGVNKKNLLTCGDHVSRDVSSGFFFIIFANSFQSNFNMCNIESRANCLQNIYLNLSER